MNSSALHIPSPLNQRPSPVYELLRRGTSGFYPDLTTVIECCRVQAAITHDTPAGINAAVAASLMTHYCLYRLGPKAELAEFLALHVEGPWTTPWQGRVGPKGMMSVRAALTAVVTHHRLSELLKACIAFTGDVDTVATIALAAASCSDEYEHDLPEPLIAGLEPGPYGYAYLKLLDQALLPG